MPRKLRVTHLYPKLMNLYGDRGNIMCLKRRCEERGIGFEVEELSLGDPFRGDRTDLVFIGGAQDREQQLVAKDLREVKVEALHEAVEKGATVLAVCGGYQLMGRYYRGAGGEEMEGVGLLDIWTEHPGEDVQRCIGNIVIEWTGRTVVGFENHGGRTYLGEGVQPLGRVAAGHGNNGADGAEGATCDGVFGTYMHGALLPKNPAFADHVIQAALSRRGKDAKLVPIDDRVEEQAHAAAVRLAMRRSMI